MEEWTTQMRNLIAQYQLIFVSGKDDRRISCEMDKDVSICHGIDKAELCVYCLTVQECFLSKLKWKFKKARDGYWFIPSADEEFEKGIEDIKKKYSECEEKSDCFKEEYPIPVYRTCDAEKIDLGFKSCNIVVDMILNMNRRERNKKELDNFNALFCCARLTIFRQFLHDAAQYIRNLKDEEKFVFLGEVTAFLEKVLSIREYIDGETKESKDLRKLEEVKVLKELEESASISIAIIRKEQSQHTIGPSFACEFDDKMKAAFAESRFWNYNKKLERKSCRDIFRGMVRFVFPEIDFSDKDDVKAVKNMLNMRKKSA